LEQADWRQEWQLEQADWRQKQEAGKELPRQLASPSWGWQQKQHEQEQE